MVVRGSCHCGTIRFELEWPGEIIPVRACSCTFCRKHGGVWTGRPDAAVVVTIADRSRVSTYAFGTRTAEFHTCTRCGVVPIATSEIDSRMHAVVNVNTFEDVDPKRLERTSTSFDGEDVESRLARRQRNWIGAVRFT